MQDEKSGVKSASRDLNANGAVVMVIEDRHWLTTQVHQSRCHSNQRLQSQLCPSEPINRSLQGVRKEGTPGPDVMDGGPDINCTADCEAPRRIGTIIDVHSE